MKNNNGATAVEFAIVLPLLLVLVFGIVEWGLFLFDDHIITNASRAGARRGIVGASPRVSSGTIRQAVLNYSNNYLVTFGTKTPPQIEVPAICVNFGDDLAVKVSYTYTFLLLPELTAGKVSPSKTITARTVMKCE